MCQRVINMKSYRPLFYMCIAVIILLIAFSAPASAFNNEATPAWFGSASNTQTITIDQTHVLTYEIRINDPGLGGNYIFRVVLEHNDSANAHHEPQTGFRITGFTTQATFPDVILSVELLNNGREIIYTLADPIVLHIDLVIQADRALVYHNEVADITASLHQHESGGPVQVADTTVVHAVSTIPAFSNSANVHLLNPSIMPAGAQIFDFSYNFMTGSLINNLSGLRFINNGYTLDFSNVVITVNGVPRTYAEWLNESDFPLTFFYADGSPLSADHRMTVFSPTTLSWNVSIPFRAVTNDNFTSGSVIHFNGLRAYGDIRVNNRGPVANLAPPPGQHFTINSPTQGFTGIARDYNVSVTILRTITENIPYIIAYSESYIGHPTHSHFRFQELFVSRISSAERDGSNVEITYIIPDGVTITHIRIPQNGSNDMTRYDNIIFVRNGVSYSLGNNGGTLNFVTGTGPGGVTGLSPLTSGENVVFRFENVSLLGPGGTTVAANHGLQFVGTTDSTITAGTPLVFSVETNETASLPRQFTTTATTTYGMSMAMGVRNTFIGNALNQPITSIELGVPFYFYARMQTPTTPSHSKHRTNPANPTTGVFSSPVFYFSLPEGVVLSPGQDAAEIVTAAGAPTIARDLNNNIITPNITNVWTNAGFYANGTLVEVKLERADAPNDVFWMTGTHWVRLQVSVHPEFDGTGIVIGPQSMILGSWDPMVTSVGQWGSQGTTVTIPAAAGKIHSGTTGVMSAQAPAETLTVINPSAVRASASIMTPLGNLTYIPGVTDSFAEIRAASFNETFRVFLSNELDNGFFPDSQLFFILPHQEHWRPTLTAPARLATASGLGANDFTIFYTTTPIDHSGIGDPGVYNISSVRDFDWTIMTFSGNTASAAIDWANVTAIRIDANLQANNERIELHLPFGTPRVDGVNINYGDHARGQTLLFLENNAYRDNVATAALVLIRSAPPVVAAVNPANPVPALFQDVTIDYLTGTIPNWNEFYTFDDLTFDLRIRDVNIVFTPFVGTPTSVTIPGSSIANVSYLPQRPTGFGGFEYDVDFVHGFRWTIANPTSHINLGTPGVFRITYTTEEDCDLQFTTRVKNITMTKCPTTISISASDTSLLWGATLNGTVENHFRPFVTVTDTETVDTSRILLIEETPAFNINQPGTYILRFEYTDIGNNRVNATMNVSVRFNGTLTGSVLGNGMPVEGFVVSIDGTPATTNATGGFSHELTATVAAPTVANYNITFTSPIPAGLRNTMTLPISGSGSASTPAPTETINFEAVSMTVNIAGPAAGVDEIRLYRVGSASPVAVIDNITGNTVFAREVGQGWFEAGNYYFVAVLNPGYRIASSDFTLVNPAVDILTARTSNFAIGNVDITRNLVVETAPLISGTVWSDVNRNSIMDSGESVITGVTVFLYDAAGTTRLQQTATNSSGVFQFIGMNEMSSYIVEIQPPIGYNRASPLVNESRINPANFRTAPIGFSGGHHVMNVNAGFYALFTVTYAGGGASGGTVPLDPTEYLWNAQATVSENTGNLWRSGYRFNGWTFNGSTYQPGSTVIVSENVTLTAAWTPLALNEFLHVTYENNGACGGTVPLDSHLYSPNEPKTVLGNTGNLWKDGYRFNGWTFNSITYQAGNTILMTQNVTLSAVWVALEPHEFLSVTYDANGASGGTVPVDDITYSPNRPATVFDNTGFLWKAGHRFDGWDFSGSTYQADDTIIMTVNVTLSAIWVPLTAGEFLFATYEPNGAHSGTVPIDTHAYSPNEPKTVLGNTGGLWRDGFVFAGWTYDGERYIAGDTIIMVENVTLSAAWGARPPGTGEATIVDRPTGTLPPLGNDTATPYVSPEVPAVYEEPSEPRIQWWIWLIWLLAVIVFLYRRYREKKEEQDSMK